jgi:glycosyltransferase involved in cell wall biosynthesis
VCIASNGLLGPVRNGGIATLYMGLAQALIADGHHVTYLYTGGAYTETDPVEYWVARHAEGGLKVVPLPEARIRVGNASEIQTSYLTYQWLREHDDFDVIHFHEWRGNGYYSLLAKHQGLAFDRATLCVGAHSPSAWNKQGNHEFLDHITDLEVDFLERQSVALADVLVSSSRYMLEYLAARGWDLPPDRRVLPNLLPASALAPPRGPGPHPAGDRPIEELVFFGRLEGRKGLALFCDALDRLAARAPRPFRATFLGKDGSIAGESGLGYVHRRCRDWPFPWQAITGLDNAQALDYLGQPGRLAVLPSLMDNSPLAVHECLLAGIPFLASEVGGIPELVRPEDRAAALFPPRAAALAQRLAAALDRPAARARPAFDEAAGRRAWLDWHREAARPRGASERAGTPADAADRPRVSVCIPHFNRPDHLSQALESLRAQDYPDFEVIVVDDGSTLPRALAYLESLAPEFAARGWRIVRQENRYPGAARNHAARHAGGEYLLFMDDDNVAKPHEISRFVQVATRTGADILTCFAEVIRGDDANPANQVPDSLWPFLGASLTIGAFYNCFGDTNALVRRDAFAAIGGFTEDYGYNHEDKELYIRAVLKGLRLEVVPEALYRYRVCHSGLNYSTSSYLNSMRGLRPFFEVLPEPVHPVLIYAHARYLEGAAPLPRQLAELATRLDWPLRYRIADRINGMVKRFAPIHRVARASLIFLVANARRAKHLSRRIDATARSYLLRHGHSLERQLTALRGPHTRDHEDAPHGSNRRA